MTTEALGTAALSTGEFIPVAVYDASWYTLQAYLRASYSIRGLYEVFAGVSADSFTGTEKGEWKVLPTVGAAWNFGSEDFLSGGALSSGRLSASWGKSGKAIPFDTPEMVIFAEMQASQLDLSASAGLWQDRLCAGVGYYNFSLDEMSFSGVTLNAKAYPVRTDRARWSLWANQTFASGDYSGSWGGAGTVLESGSFDLRANLYWNPDYLRCANVTAGYTLGRDLLKFCSARLFVNARNLVHKSLYADFDPAVDFATAAPGRFALTCGASIEF